MTDVIVAWPRCCDYPLWREFITRERERFGEVFVVFTDLAERDFSPFVRATLPNVTFLDTHSQERDWRDVAVNLALDHSKAERVWFTEQDFLITDPAFWDQTDGPVVGIDMDDGRPYHPACLFVDRARINRTARYFGPFPRDHFYTFGAELGPGHLITSGYRHFQAISESQMRCGMGLQPTFRPEQFREWVALNLAADVPIDPLWRALIE